MSVGIFIFSSIAYILALFGVAYFSDRWVKKGKSLVSNPYIYSLSLAVFCTAWTFYGSVGKAAASGLGFLPIYLGPTIFAPLWLLVIRKMILISKLQRITSIADFISSRYGKSAFLGGLVTMIALIGVIPYISLQIRAIAGSFDILTMGKNFLTPSLAPSPSFFYTAAFYVTVVLAAFTILFGARNLEPNERHEGLVMAIAFESFVKLFTFLAIGIFVTFFLYNGFEDIFHKATLYPKTAELLGDKNKPNGIEWLWLNILSMFAVILLPRQFHIGVVENSNPNFIAKAMWLFPLYMLLINIFVLPIALAGLMQFGGTDFKPDNFVLGLPLAAGNNLLALMVFLGGLSAATSMVIVETTALSIMISNHLVMPPLIRSMLNKENEMGDFSGWFIGVRRISIILILLTSFVYVQTIGSDISLVSIGLVSFTAVSQFAPVVFGGIFWKGATKWGAMGGLIIGFLLWAITLPIPALAEVGILPHYIIDQGYFHIALFKPYALLGLKGFDRISHAAFWSILLNTATYIGVSLNTRPTPIEVTQADFFVNIYKYITTGNEFEVVKREAQMKDLVLLLKRFMGEERTQTLLQKYEEENTISLAKITKATADLVNYTETQLAGAIGASSAKILIASVVKEDPISLDEMLNILDQTHEIMTANKALEYKSKELEQTTRKLQTANEQLQELDRLKADFVTTVTHELRTPMTSIKALSKILLDNQNLSKEKREEFLNIVVLETERVSRLINQVLDIEKMQSNAFEWTTEQFDLNAIVNRAYKSFVPTFDQRSITHHCKLPTQPTTITGDSDRITQVIVNLLSNALKFSKPTNGIVNISLRVAPEAKKAILHVSDNGVGIAIQQQPQIFDKFTQINNPQMGKPNGSGLGLFITSRIIHYHNGTIRVESKPEMGAVFIVELPI